MKLEWATLRKLASERYASDGLFPFLVGASSFVHRYLVEQVGRAGLYRSDRFIDFLVWWNSNRGRYDIVADPISIIEVDPSRIHHVTNRGPFPGKFMWQDLGLITGGNWDQPKKSVEEIPKISVIIEHYQEGKPWDELYLNNQPVSELDSWREYVDNLYSSIEKLGYRHQYELLPDAKSPTPFSGNEYRGIQRFSPCDEVVIDIGRDGQFLFVDGRHRLAIAKALGLETIPVRVSARHEGWQKIREIAHRGGSGEGHKRYINKCQNHPDIVDLIGDN